MNLHRQPAEPDQSGACVRCGEGEADYAVSRLCRDCYIEARDDTSAGAHPTADLKPGVAA